MALASSPFDGLSMALSAVGIVTAGCVFVNGNESGILGSTGIEGAITAWTQTPIGPQIPAWGGHKNSYNFMVGDAVLFGVGTLLLIIGMASPSGKTIMGAIIGVALIGYGLLHFATGATS